MTEIKRLRALAEYVASYPACSNSSADTMALAIDDLKEAASAVLAGKPVPEDDSYICLSCEPGIETSRLAPPSAADCPACGESSPDKWRPDDANPQQQTELVRVPFTEGQ